MIPATFELARARMDELTADAERARVNRRTRLHQRAVRRARRAARPDRTP